MYKHFIKRALDFFASLIGILMLALPMLIIAVVIKIDSPGPAIFRQKRFGLHKKPFYILKFRTMSVDAPKNKPTCELCDSQMWITKVGRFLRKTSLDEIPQIFNIFIGQMSFVGPRPVILAEEDLINERDKYGANDVKPGLTGWAQINGRDELKYDVKAKLDGEYVNRLSFLFDFKCLFGTIKIVCNHDGQIEGNSGETASASTEQESVTH